MKDTSTKTLVKHIACGIACATCLMASSAKGAVAASARTLNGVIYRVANNTTFYAGIAQLTVGRANASGIFSIGGKLTMVNGKTFTLKKTKAAETGGNVVMNNIQVKDYGTITITLSPTTFKATLSTGYSVKSANITKMDAGALFFRISTKLGTMPKIDGLPILTAYLPLNTKSVQISSSGTKWILPKAGKVTYKNGVVSASSTANPCGLKLSYTPKKGTFKGSFNVYMMNDALGKLTKRNAKVTGVTINGIGYANVAVGDGTNWQALIQ